MKRIALAALAVAVVLGMAYLVLLASQKSSLPFSTCIDGSPVTVVSQDDNQINYRCGSGTTGWYLKPKR